MSVGHQLPIRAVNSSNARSSGSSTRTTLRTCERRRLRRHRLRLLLRRRREGDERVRPKRVQGRPQLVEPVRIEPVEPPRPLLAGDDESRFFEHPQVLRDGRPAHREAVRELADGPGAATEPLEDRPPGWTAECVHRPSVSHYLRKCTLTDCRRQVGAENPLVAGPRPEYRCARGFRAPASDRVSRPRLVACSDAARAELGKALHDGAQQRVVAVSLLLRSLRGQLDDAESLALVDRALAELGETGEELRDLSRRLHPVALSECGLRPALFAATTRAPVPVDLDIPEERLPGEVERAAYDVVLGAIECAGEHSSHLQVSLARDNGIVTLDVNGCGELGGERLCALVDRVETIRGTLELDGTLLRARFPLEKHV